MSYEDMDTINDRTKVPTEVLSGGMRMQFYVPTGQLPMFDEQVDKLIQLKIGENLIIHCNLVKVATAKIKDVDKEVNIYNQIVVDVEKIIYTEDDDPNGDAVIILELPDKKEEISDTVRITY